MAASHPDAAASDWHELRSGQSFAGPDQSPFYSSTRAARACCRTAAAATVHTGSQRPAASRTERFLSDAFETDFATRRVHMRRRPPELTLFFALPYQYSASLLKVPYRTVSQLVRPATVRPPSITVPSTQYYLRIPRDKKVATEVGPFTWTAAAPGAGHGRAQLRAQLLLGRAHSPMSCRAPPTGLTWPESGLRGAYSQFIRSKVTGGRSLHTLMLSHPHTFRGRLVAGVEPHHGTRPTAPMRHNSPRNLTTN